jgi:hypothetical protein
MGTREGVDYSYARLSGAALAQAGISFVCRYLSHDAGKNLSLAEVHDLRAAGIDVVSVWESTQLRPLEGEAAGLDDGREAGRQAAGLGAFPGAAIYFAVDFDITGRPQSQIDAILGYFRGARQTIGPYSPGVYGGLRTINLLAANPGLVDYYWQTYAWSNGQVHARAHIYQYRNDVQLAGVTVDRNRGLQEPFGQWGAPMREEEEDMFSFTDPKNGCKALCDRSGAVFNFNPDGTPGGHYLGGLNSHPEWSAGDGRANGPVVAFEPFDDGSAVLSAYVIITRDAGGTFHPYQFPSSGALATP